MKTSWDLTYSTPALVNISANSDSTEDRSSPLECLYSVIIIFSLANLGSTPLLTLVSNSLTNISYSDFSKGSSWDFTKSENTISRVEGCIGELYAFSKPVLSAILKLDDLVDTCCPIDRRVSENDNARQYFPISV